MYRAVAFAALRRGVDPSDAEPVAHLVDGLELDGRRDDGVTVDGVDATIEIRGPEVTRAVSLGGRQPRGARRAAQPPAGVGRAPRRRRSSRAATSAPWCSPTPTSRCS